MWKFTKPDDENSTSYVFVIVIQPWSKCVQQSIMTKGEALEKWGEYIHAWAPIHIPPTTISDLQNCFKNRDRYVEERPCSELPDGDLPICG